jgi:hypothetical protein
MREICHPERGEVQIPRYARDDRWHSECPCGPSAYIIEAHMAVSVSTVRARAASLAERKADSLASGLGWFSIGLGLAQVVMPERVAHVAGIEPTPGNIRLMRSFGLRELTAGVGVLTQPVPDRWMWNRVAGDALDLAMLGIALGSDRNHRGRTIGATIAVLGVTGLDVLAATQLARKRHDAELSNESIGERALFRILTVKAHPANVENDWYEFVANQGSDESRAALVTFRPAPGARGTEIRARLSWKPRAGTIGETAQRLRHKSPGQVLGHDLKRFKMLVEVGETVKSDASIHKHMHPARPSDTLENANLVREEAR